MTREEAIAQLKMDRNLCNFNPMTGEEEPMNEDCRKSVVALDMAIDALQQEPSEDCVSRQAVLYALDKRFDSIPMEQTTEILLLRKDLRELPPVTPQKPILDKIRAEIEEEFKERVKRGIW